MKLCLDTVWSLNWRLLSGGLSIRLIRQEHLSCEEKPVQPGEEMALGGHNSSPHGELIKKIRGSLFTVVRSKRMRSNGHELQQGESQLGIKRKIHCEDNQTEEQDIH